MKNLIKIIKIILLTVLNTSCTRDEIFNSEYYQCSFVPIDSSSANPQYDKYQNLLNRITSSGVPGIQMSIYTPTEGMWLGAAGKADLKSNIQLEPCNITRVGSIVKTFTATTILLLQEEGKLNLNDRITNYLSSYDIRDIENADQVTIKQLLQHSSGIYNYILNSNFQLASFNDLIKEWGPDDLLEYARGENHYFSPGTDVRYSNTNYILLGMIISNIENKPFYKVFEDKIFSPLSLNSTQFAAENTVPDGIIRGYIDLYSKLNLINTTYYSGWDYYTADGGLISNVYDLNTFTNALFNGQIISQPSLNQMLDFSYPNNPNDDFFSISYGLGTFKIETEWGDAYQHSGDAIGYYASTVYFPNDDITICWAVNANYGKIDDLISSKYAMEDIFRTVLE